MSCLCCDWTAEDARETAKLAYGPLPDDSALLTGKQIQFFARKVIEDQIKFPRLLEGLEE